MTSPRAYVAGARRNRRVSERGTGTWGRVRRVADTDDTWQRVEARAREAETSAGACDTVSGRSWLGFARDWLFCLSMPFIWQLNAQNVDI